MNNVLLTGFGPFREHEFNPSQVIAERLNGEQIGGVSVTGLTLPVVFGMDTELAFAAIDALKPCLVLSLGLNAGIDGIDLEMFAINRRYGSSEGELIPIVGDGPAAYFATIDIDRIINASSSKSPLPIRKHGYAGSYLCNHIFYQTLHHAAVNSHSYAVGFVHIPLAAEHVKESSNHQPSYPLGAIAASIRLIIEAALQTDSNQPDNA